MKAFSGLTSLSGKFPDADTAKWGADIHAHGTGSARTTALCYGLIMMQALTTWAAVGWQAIHLGTILSVSLYFPTLVQAELGREPVSGVRSIVVSKKRSKRAPVNQLCDGHTWRSPNTRVGGPVAPEVQQDGSVVYHLGLLSRQAIDISYPEPTSVERVVVRLGVAKIQAVALFVGAHRFELGAPKEPAWTHDRGSPTQTEGWRCNVTEVTAVAVPQSHEDLHSGPTTVREALQGNGCHHIAIDCRAPDSQNDVIDWRSIVIKRSAVRTRPTVAVQECTGPRTFLLEINSVTSQCVDERCRIFEQTGSNSNQRRSR